MEVSDLNAGVVRIFRGCDVRKDWSIASIG